MAGFAFLFEVTGTLDGTTPVVLPRPLPAPVNGVHVIPVPGNFGRWDPLDDTPFDSPTAYYLRALHGEYSAATRAVKFDAAIPGVTAELSIVPPIQGNGTAPLQELEQFPLTRILPKGSQLVALNDSANALFTGVPVAGPHRIYVEIEPLSSEDDIVSVLEAAADAEDTGSSGGCELELLDFGAIPDGETDASTPLQTAIDRAAALGGGTVCCPAGRFRLGSTVVLRGGVKVKGAGAATAFFSDDGVSPAFDAATTVDRAELAYCQVIGPNPTAQTGIGIDLDQAQFVTLDHVQVWYYDINLRLSAGAPFAAYHEIDGCQFNVSGSVNVQALGNCNACRITNSRIFWSFTDVGGGVGLDVDDASSLSLANVTIESADRCIRVRSTTGALVFSYIGCFLEPGVNPVTLQAGLAEDIVITSTTGLVQIVAKANTLSANRTIIDVPAEGLSEIDHPQRQFFGARVHGASTPKRNLVRNGTLDEWALPSFLDNWFFGGAIPVFAEDTVTFYTGVRAILLTATGITSTISAGAEISEPACDFITFGVRYKVGPGNTGVVIAANGGFGAQQLVDDVPGTNLLTDPWRVRSMTVPVNHASPFGSLAVAIDQAAGVGQVLIDSIWATTGEYAQPTTQHAQRLVRLTAPVTIRTNQNANGNEVWTADLLALGSDAAIAPALQDLLAPPLGVIGALLRLRLTVTDGAANTILANFGSLYADVPPCGGVVAADTFQVQPVWSEREAEQQFLVRANPDFGAARNVSGGYVNRVGNPNRTFNIALVAWYVE